MGGPRLFRILLRQELGIGPLLASRTVFGVELIHGPEQLIPLCLQPLECHDIHARLGSGIGRFPMGSGKLLMQSRLFDATIPDVLLTTEEQGLVPAAIYEGQRRRNESGARRRKIEIGGTNRWYLADRGDNIAHHAQYGG